MHGQRNIKKKPVQHVAVLNTAGNCNTMVGIIILYYNIIILWDHLVYAVFYINDCSKFKKVYVIERCLIA